MANCTPTYPDAYHRILLALPEDGKPLVVPFTSEGEAERERLRFYNFLKWCRRAKNMMAVAHLAGRYNTVSLARKGPELHFMLNTVMRFHDTESAIDKALAAAGLDNIPLPPQSAHPKLLRPLVKGEVSPAMPDISPAPVIADSGFAFADPTFEADMQAKFAELIHASNLPDASRPETKPLNTEEATWLGERRS